MNETPKIPTLEEVKKILGDRRTKWTKEQIVGALAYVDVLAERFPPGKHSLDCEYVSGIGKKGVLCTCDPDRPC